MNIRRPADLRRRSDKKNSRRHLIVAGVGVLFFASLVGVGFAIRQSSIFEIHSIATAGISDAAGQQVLVNLRDFSNQHSWLFRFLGERNMIAWGGNERAFLDANPDVKAIDIEKNYVNRSIVISIVGREKFGVWCHQEASAPVDTSIASSTETVEATPPSDRGSEACYWFDREGTLFAKAPLVRSELFNRVFDTTGRQLALREKIMPERLFVNLVRVFNLLAAAQINTKTVTLADLALEEVSADSISDPRIIMSLRFDPTFALSAIDALKKTGEWNKLSYADFTAENKVVYR